jgi:WD40 repeat protein
MERNARAGTPYELTPDSRLSKAPFRDELTTEPVPLRSSMAEHTIIPMTGQELVAVSAIAGTGEEGHQDGTAAEAMLYAIDDLLLLSDGRVLLTDYNNRWVFNFEDQGGRIRVLSADLQQVTTVAGGGVDGHQDGAAAQAQFRWPHSLALLSDGCVLVADRNNHCIRMLSADMQEISTVAGSSELGPGVAGPGRYGAYQDGAAAQARFRYPSCLAVLPDGRVLVADFGNACIRMLSANLQEVSTVAGDGVAGHQDGAAAQARFYWPSDLVVMLDGRVLVADKRNNCIRVLSANLQEVSTLTNADGRDDPDTYTVGGDVMDGHHDGAVVQARFSMPGNLALLPDGRVLVQQGQSDSDHSIRVLSADLQEVSTLAIDDVDHVTSVELLPGGRVLIAGENRIRMLEGLVALMGTKPAAKPPKTKRAPASGASASSGGAHSSQPALKRGRSGAGPSSAAAISSISDSDDGDGSASAV